MLKSKAVLARIMGDELMSRRIFLTVSLFEDIPIVPDGYKAVQVRDSKGRFTSETELVWVGVKMRTCEGMSRIYLIDTEHLDMHLKEPIYTEGRTVVGEEFTFDYPITCVRAKAQGKVKDLQ